VLPFKLVYHADYDVQLVSHVFPSQKYRMVRERLLESGFADPDDFVQPESATEEDLTLAHTTDWIRRLRAGLLTFEEAAKLEIPYNETVIRGFWLATGGSMLAARLALQHGGALNIGGGFHHAYAAHGEGFCAVNDVAVAVRRMLADKLIERAMIIDCDVHHGNGTASIFLNDPAVFTLSIHQYANYPEDKPPSSLDIHLGDGVGDEEYLAKLETGYAPALAEFKPNLIVYVAGADPHCEDQLGGLNLTKRGLEQRDRLVFDAALQARVPVGVVLAGGYSFDVRDTVEIHCNTAKCLRDAMESVDIDFVRREKGSPPHRE
jgi:acetoin utilization deacetylase AcuC-like enzyme